MGFIADKRLLATLTVGLALGASSLHAAGLVKWVDEKGVTHYGDSIPPEYAGRSSVELSSHGVVLSKTEGALTPAQRKAREEQLAREKVEQKKQAEQERRDVAIVSTYTSQKEIDVVRDRTMQTIEAKLLVAEAQLKAAEGLEDALIKQLAPYAAKGLDGKYVRIAPMTLVLAYEKNEIEMKNLTNTKKLYQTERAEAMAKFDGDKARYNELKTGSSATPTNK